MRGYATQDKLRSITDHSDDHSIGASDQMARLDFHLGQHVLVFAAFACVVAAMHLPIKLEIGPIYPAG